MRAIVALSFAALTLLSGCLEESAEPAGEADDDRVAEQPTQPQATRPGVEVFNAIYEATPGQPATLTVDVPEGAVNVQYQLGTKASVPAGTEATLTLAGCGSADVTWSSVGIAGGNNWQGGELCSAAEAGSQTLTIEALLVPLTGNVVLVADLP
jgi:hypothetical protein